MVRTSSPFSEFRVVPENHDANFGLVEIQCQAGNAITEVDHLVEHGIAQAFNLCDTVANLADDTHVLLGGRGLSTGDLRLDFF